MSQEFVPPRFVYWRVNSRAQMAMLMLHAAELPYEWDSYTANTWPNPKEEMPFGQLPVLFHKELIIAQSATITRYCAKLAKLMPEDSETNIKVDMLMEHCADIFSLFEKAKYSPNSDIVAAATNPYKIKEEQYKVWGAVKNIKLPQKLDYLVKHLGDNQFFSWSDTFHAGDVAVFSTLYLVVQAGLGSCLEKYPSLWAHYERMKLQGTIQQFLDENYPPYFVAAILPDAEIKPQLCCNAASSS